MASKRRGGFRPPELRGTLGTLLRTTWQQAGVVRDAIARGASEGKSRLDDARAQRKRHDALAELGELVLDLIRRGEIDLEELPEARELVLHLDELETGGDDDIHDREPALSAPPAARRRNRDEHPTAQLKPRDRDGTVSSGTWSPPRSAQPSRVWRPPADEVPAAETSRAPKPTKKLTRDPARKGGISFDHSDDDDDDLADYMHPDDVPPKGTPDGEA